MIINRYALGMFLLVLSAATPGTAGNNKPKNDSLQDYVRRIKSAMDESTVTPIAGSLWRDGGALAEMTSDSTAHGPGDLITIRIVEQTLAEASGSVSSERTFNVKSGISSIAGRISSAGVDPLAVAQSNNRLKGEAQTASSSSLRTSVAGQIVAVLPNGNFIVEARRSVLINNERQTIVLRGVARPGDISANNVVLSTQLGELELELRGKGAVSEATRQPNWIVRTLLKVLSF